MIVPHSEAQPFFTTDLGATHVCDPEQYLPTVEADSVDLILCPVLPHAFPEPQVFASGSGDPYTRWFEWFKPLAYEFARILRSRGSLALLCESSWMPKRPTRSVAHIRLLLDLCCARNEGGPGWHLAQELFWLPDVEHIEDQEVWYPGRVRAGVRCIWWLSQDTNPKADNRRVLKPYSDSQKRLMKNGSKQQRRPSGHIISTTFAKDNGGAIPPNMIFGGESAVAELLIGLCTEEGDLVLAPLAQSNGVGIVAERMGRRWLTLAPKCGVFQKQSARTVGKAMPPRFVP